MKAATGILGLTVIHFVLSRLLFLLSFASSSSRFETLEPPSAPETAVIYAAKLLDFPLAFLIEKVPLHEWFPGVWGYIPFLLNSALWGATLFCLIVLYRRRRTREQDV